MASVSKNVVFFMIMIALAIAVLTSTSVNAVRSIPEVSGNSVVAINRPGKASSMLKKAPLIACNCSDKSQSCCLKSTHTTINKTADGPIKVIHIDPKKIGKLVFIDLTKNYKKYDTSKKIKNNNSNKIKN